MRAVTGVMAALLVTAARAEEPSSEGTAATSATARELRKRRTFVGLVVPLSARGFSLEGEQELDERFSVNLGLRMGFSVGEEEGRHGDEDTRYLLLGAEPGARFYMTGSAMDGLWFGPRLELARAWREPSTATTPALGESFQREWHMGGAVLLGYSLRLRHGFSVQAALGVGVTNRFVRQSGATAPLEGGEPHPWTDSFVAWNVGHRAQLAVGWTF
ncbi:DUF3575 domain-containing protein [Archangium sp.]|jgi:hypothetical protein|uniref:DUF3575 domain-containing protein n=1 Tax=Archangium sp. TaxID=1872627 RepID=UPI002EDB1C3E